MGGSTAELRDLAVSEDAHARTDGMKKLERGVTTLEEIVKETAQ
jgi:type II secretory ATPase GspE/PulE/Tfp pilus assembly ATPase PilB-like protein